MKSNKIYATSFCEGAAVMATELCGSKLISPFFGSSLYVWASVIAISLGSLAMGYFYGGRLSVKETRSKILINILLFSALYMGCMPLISGALKLFAIGFSLIPAVIMSAVVLLFVPMFLMGGASPLIIALQTTDNNESGRISGLVYSISTFGGIIATFLSGFYLIPVFGLHITLIAFAILLLLSLFFISKEGVAKIGCIFVALLILGFKKAPLAKNCIYETDGLLGKLDILEDTHEIIGKGNSVTRKLLVNHVVQSEMDIKTMNSVSDYVGILDANIKEGSGKALVLGLGGGLTSNLFIKKGYEVDGVELDGRIIDIAKKYFYLNEKVKTYEDDARHFINGNSEKYDLILVDIFKAEEQPAHVITIESLAKLKQNLADNAMLVINWHGYSSGEKGLGTSILLNTFTKAGFKIKSAASSASEDYRNLVFFASLDKVNITKYEIAIETPPTELVNSDTHPVLEKYNALANQAWRKNYIKYYYSKQ